MIADCCTFMTAIFLVRKMLENPSYPPPNFRMDPFITDYHFTPRKTFILEGYQWAPSMRRFPSPYRRCPWTPS